MPAANYKLVTYCFSSIDQLRYLENTCEVEFKQASNDLKASFNLL